MKRFLLAAAALAPMRQAVTEKPRREPSGWFYAGRGYGKSELVWQGHSLARGRGSVLTRNGSVITFT